MREAQGMEPPYGNANRSYYFDPRLDCLLDLGRTHSDPARRRRYYAEAQRILATDLPVLPLWHEDTVAVMNRRVAGYDVLPIPRFTPLARVTISEAQ
jgi:peptide/nickel transport system substrate-binding protein